MPEATTTIRLIAGAMMIAAVPPAAAQPPAAPPGVGTLSLSDAEKAELLDHGTESSVAAARDGIADDRRASRQIHGEIGAAIGSHGTRDAYGTAAIPIGDHAGATVSFESSRSGYPH